MNKPPFDLRQDRYVPETSCDLFNEQTNYIGTGNVIATTQFSGYIRPWNDTSPGWSGKLVTEGQYHQFDIAPFRDIPQVVAQAVRRIGDRVGQTILYEFRHFNGVEKVIDGYVLTGPDPDYELLAIFRDYGSHSTVIDECAEYISNKGNEWDVVYYGDPGDWGFDDYDEEDEWDEGDLDYDEELEEEE